jgi:hypothetical protein
MHGNSAHQYPTKFMQELQQINCIVGYLDEYDANALQESHLRAKLFSFPLQVREQLLMGLSVSAEKAILWENLFHSNVQIWRATDGRRWLKLHHHKTWIL